MTRHVSKNGNAYTEGSHNSMAGFPRVCYGCGEKAVQSRQKLWQETLEPSGEKRTWHHGCRLAVSA